MQHLLLHQVVIFVVLFLTLRKNRSLEDATQTQEVLQTTTAPTTEVLSKIFQNADITTQTEEIEVDVAEHNPLKTETTPLEEDAGAYSMVSEEQVKTIRTNTVKQKWCLKRWRNQRTKERCTKVKIRWVYSQDIS